MLKGRGGSGLLYGPDGEALDGEPEAPEEPERPQAECDYCGRKRDMRREVDPIRGTSRWRLPEDWRELPNELIECPNCRPVRDVSTGRMVRPDPEMRGGPNAEDRR